MRKHHNTTCIGGIYYTAEDLLQKQINSILTIKKEYKSIAGLWNFNPATSLKKTLKQGAKLKYLGQKKGVPDFELHGLYKRNYAIFSENRPQENVLFRHSDNEYYAGFFLELKVLGTVIYNKDGTLRADKHIRNQALYLENLRNAGCYANFAIGFDSFFNQINTFLKYYELVKS